MKQKNGHSRIFKVKDNGWVHSHQNKCNPIRKYGSIFPLWQWMKEPNSQLELGSQEGEVLVWCVKSGSWKEGFPSARRRWAVLACHHWGVAATLNPHFPPVSCSNNTSQLPPFPLIWQEGSPLWFAVMCLFHIAVPPIFPERPGFARWIIYLFLFRIGTLKLIIFKHPIRHL